MSSVMICSVGLDVWVGSLDSIGEYYGADECI